MNSTVESSAQEKVRKYFRYVVEHHKLPSLPAVAGKVLRMIQDPDLNVQKLSRVLSDDAALAGESGATAAAASSPQHAPVLIAESCRPVIGGHVPPAGWMR